MIFPYRRLLKSEGEKYRASRGTSNFTISHTFEKKKNLVTSGSIESCGNSRDNKLQCGVTYL